MGESWNNFLFQDGGGGGSEGNMFCVGGRRRLPRVSLVSISTIRFPYLEQEFFSSRSCLRKTATFFSEVIFMLKTKMEHTCFYFANKTD